MTTPTNLHVIVVGGTWETKPYGLLGDVVGRTSKTWQPHWVDYPASYGTPESYAVSKSAGKAELRALMTRIPATDTFAIVAYSQGCAVVEELIRDMADSGSFQFGVLARLKYVGLVASPYRPRGVQVGNDPGGFGISGPLTPSLQKLTGQNEPKLIWQYFALAGDLITACPPDTLVRIIETLTPAMSAADPLGWARDLQSKITVSFVRKNFPELRTFNLLRLLQRVTEAARAVRQYQKTGIHMQYSRQVLLGKNVTATQWIAMELNEIARNPK